MVNASVTKLHPPHLRCLIWWGFHRAFSLSPLSPGLSSLFPLWFFFPGLLSQNVYILNFPDYTVPTANIADALLSVICAGFYDLRQLDVGCEAYSVRKPAILNFRKKSDIKK